MKALLDTSVLIAQEQDRPLGALPDELTISVMTLAELLGGVLAAEDAVRSRRVETLRQVESRLIPLPVDESVARTFADMATVSRRAGKKPGIIDMLIAATAIAHDLPLYTQDLEQAGLPGVRSVVV